MSTVQFVRTLYIVLGLFTLGKPLCLLQMNNKRFESSLHKEQAPGFAGGQHNNVFMLNFKCYMKVTYMFTSTFSVTKYTVYKIDVN